MKNYMCFMKNLFTITNSNFLELFGVTLKETCDKQMCRNAPSLKNTTLTLCVPEIMTIICKNIKPIIFEASLSLTEWLIT